MLLDLLSLDNYVNYNIKIAEMLGLHEAIYLSELMNINEKAVRKAKVTDNYFTVDRKYITKRTTLSKDEQISIDKKLTELGILKYNVEDNNILILNIGLLISLLNGDTEFEKVNLPITAKKSTKRKTKEEQSKEEMKTYIEVTNSELYDAYCEWIDAVFAKLHWMSRKSVEVAQKSIDEASGRNLDIALKILEIATVNGWKDVSYAIKKYKEDYEPSYRIKYAKQAPQPIISEQRNDNDLSEEVF